MPTMMFKDKDIQGKFFAAAAASLLEESSELEDDQYETKRDEACGKYSSYNELEHCIFSLQPRGQVHSKCAHNQSALGTQGDVQRDYLKRETKNYLQWRET